MSICLLSQILDTTTSLRIQNIVLAFLNSITSKRATLIWSAVSLYAQQGGTDGRHPADYAWLNALGLTVTEQWRSQLPNSSWMSFLRSGVAQSMQCSPWPLHMKRCPSRPPPSASSTFVTIFKCISGTIRICSVHHTSLWLAAWSINRQSVTWHWLPSPILSLTLLHPLPCIPPSLSMIKNAICRIAANVR